MSQTRLVDIPEILTSIARYLPLQDLRSCSRVCHLWNNVFSPFVWQTLTVSHPAEYLGRRAHWIHCLYGPVHIPQILIQDQCTNLTLLHLSQRSFWPKRSIPNFRSQKDIGDLWVHFIRQNPRIQELSIEGTGVYDQYILLPFLDRLPEVLPDLSGLSWFSIQGCLRPACIGSVLRTISPRLLHLRLDIKGMKEEDFEGVTFPCLESLQIDCSLESGSLSSFLARHGHVRQQRVLLSPLMTGLPPAR